MNSIPNPASIAPSASDSGAVPLPPLAVSGITAEESRSHRNRSSFFVAVRAFLSGLIDDFGLSTRLFGSRNFRRFHLERTAGLSSGEE